MIVVARAHRRDGARARAQMYLVRICAFTFAGLLSQDRSGYNSVQDVFLSYLGSGRYSTVQYITQLLTAARDSHD